MARSKHRGRRFLIYLFTLALAFLGVRSLGPSVFAIRGDAVAPSLQRGDLVFARSLRDLPARDAIVLVENEARWDEETALSPRIVVGLPGDTVSFSINAVVVFTDQAVHRYDVTPLYQGISGESQEIEVSADEVFLIATDAGYVDSRIAGVVQITDLQYYVTTILWPADRRRSL